MNFLCLATMLVLVAATFANGQRPGTGRKSRMFPPLEGPKIFRMYCAACHGGDGKGGGPVAGALKHGVPDLTSISRRNEGRFPRERVKAIIAGEEQSASAHGTREMPVFGPVFHDVEWDQDLGEVRLDNVTKYLESIQQR
jgi:mono/diheme cytochrome c family protein